MKIMANQPCGCQSQYALSLLVVHIFCCMFLYANETEFMSVIEFNSLIYFFSRFQYEILIHELFVR